MDTPVIGIKIANGTYFPILNTTDSVKKRVILTPVSAGQTDVKIDIFRGDGEGMFNPVYVASLILNNIQENNDNSTEIELLIGISDENILDAEAFDRISGEKQLLSISLEAIDETDFFEIPDDTAVPYFSAEMADTEDFDELPLDVSEDFSDTEPFENENETIHEDPAPYLYDFESSKSDKRFSALKIAIVFLSIVFVIFLVLLIFTLVKKPALAEEDMKEDTKKEVVIETEEKVINTVEKVQIPVVAENIVTESKKESADIETKAVVKEAPQVIRYKIKRGDTLWDISSAYYRTPWLYKKIAKDNNIKNPDLIFAGTYLNIKE